MAAAAATVLEDGSWMEQLLTTISDWRNAQHEEIEKWHLYLLVLQDKEASDKIKAIIQCVHNILSHLTNPLLSFEALLIELTAIQKVVRSALYYNSPDFKNMLEDTIKFFTGARDAAIALPEYMSIVRHIATLSSTPLEQVTVLEQLNKLQQTLLKDPSTEVQKRTITSILSAHIGNIIHILETPDLTHEERLKNFEALVDEKSECETFLALGYHADFRATLVNVHQLLVRATTGERALRACSLGSLDGLDGYLDSPPPSSLPTPPPPRTNSFNGFASPPSAWSFRKRADSSTAAAGGGGSSAAAPTPPSGSLARTWGAPPRAASTPAAAPGAGEAVASAAPAPA